MSSPLSRFAHSQRILTPFVKNYACGWFDGGCFIFARALQLWLGGCLAVIIRQELFHERLFDHVVLSLPGLPDFSQRLFVDADGVATASELLQCWRTRERLVHPVLDDPADGTRFAGTPDLEPVSRWLARELELNFGKPEGRQLLRVLGRTSTGA